MTNKELELIAARGRCLGMQMVFRAASGHIGGSLSAMDILTELYFEQLNVDPARPQAPERDRFVMSKGHCTPALYSILALRGYYPEKQLELFRSIDGHMSGHPDMVHVPGVDMSTGSLGQGLSAAVGMALAGKMDGAGYRVCALMGDGEIEEGQIWEAAMSAAKYKLDNLCGIVDVNGLQIDGRTADVMPSEPLDAKFAAFGWNVVSIPGNDMAAVDSALTLAKETKGKPTVIILNTTKGCGVSFMENLAVWHHKVMDDAQYETAMAEIAERKASL